MPDEIVDGLLARGSRAWQRTSWDPEGQVSVARREVLAERPVHEDHAGETETWVVESQPGPSQALRPRREEEPPRQAPIGAIA